MTIFKLYTEHCVRKSIKDSALHLNYVFFSHLILFRNLAIFNGAGFCH
ncbi:Uncharacterised protein [Vibrio cholerae]|uniref:Uncharacterized protein n=1 Tax=Vibrio cholerae TaxID=666 RepID=A0A655R8V7_VIBCL|nr:Uncharacterised protein [Vibrio cholerae]